MKILLAIDTSPRADATIATVRRMYASSGASVVVLCVVGENEPETIPSPVLLASVAQDLEVLAGDLVRDHETIAARAVRMLQDAGFAAVAEVRAGDPREVIVAAARAHDVDLIVVGFHGHSAAHRMMAGCVASHLVAHAPCDVLVVPHPHH
jgi:nucleotide-binding universal stress UspA family protein